MKIQYLSDLHLEFADYAPLSADADVVVLAGDIDLKGRGVAWALRHFKQPVVYVPGNHEFYKGSLGKTVEKMRVAAQGTNVHVLNDEELIIDNVRFLAATLWTDYRLTGNEPLAQWDAQQTMSDFKQIRDEQYRKIRPTTLSARHLKSRQFIQAALDRPFNGRTVVVTHHAPCELSIAEEYLDSGGHLNASYASRLEGLMGPGVAAWIHGHTHNSLDYELHGTRVLCNPRGYAPSDLNPEFNPRAVLELDTL